MAEICKVVSIETARRKAPLNRQKPTGAPSQRSRHLAKWLLGTTTRGHTVSIVLLTALMTTVLTAAVIMGSQGRDPLPLDAIEIAQS